MNWLLDQLLALLQRQCKHPSSMVAVDILDGCANGVGVSYRNRCGAIKTDWGRPHPDNQWRRPDPNLWRG